MPAENHSECGSDVERAVMTVLLHGRPLLSRTELMREVAGSRDSEGDVEDAIEALYAKGLVHIVDSQYLLATLPARAADGLGF